MYSFDSAISAIQAMARDLRAMPMAVRNRVSVAVKDEINLLLQEQFDGGFDPDGRPWAPLAMSTLRRGRHSPPLTDTGRMRAHVRAVRVGTNVAIESEPPAVYHQSGTSRMPRRQIWPDTLSGMPARYESRLGLVANQAMLLAIRSPVLSAAE